MAELGRSLAGFSKAQEDGVLVSYRCCNKYHKCSGLKKLKFIHSLTALEGRRPRWVLRAVFLLETLRWVVLASSSVPGTPAFLGAWPCPPSPEPAVSIFFPLYLPLVRPPVITLGPLGNPPPEIPNHIGNMPFEYTLTYPQGLGRRMWTSGGALFGQNRSLHLTHALT